MQIKKKLQFHDTDIDIGKGYYYRKIHSISNDSSFGIIIPKEYIISFGLKKGSFVRVCKNSRSIIIEKDDSI